MFVSIDQNQDYSKKELYKFVSGKQIPEFVKQAGLEEVDLDRTDSAISKSAFADAGGRYFPINSKLRTYVSTVYFINKSAELKQLKGKAYIEKIASALDKAATIFGIQKEVEQYALDWLCEKVAQETEDSSIVLKVANNEFNLFTIKTADDCVNKANAFAKEINKYPYQWRRDIATQFVKVAEKYSLEELPDLVLKYAGHYYPDITAVKTELERRLTKLSEENKDRYKQLITDLKNFSSKEDFFKLADICYYTEKNAGLYDKPYYRKVLGDPVDKIFSLHLDKVAELLDVINMGGEKFAAEDLKGIPADIYEKSFGFELDPKSAEAFDILPTMPKSDVALFKKLSGVRPI